MRNIDRMLSRLGPQRTAEAQQHLRRISTAEGISFKFDGRIGSSGLAHQSTHFAKSQGLDVQSRCAEELFCAHFGEKDITKIEVLVEAGAQAGLEWLERNRGAQEVEEEEREVRELGIKGIPHFVIAGKHHIDGAGDVMNFFETFIVEGGRYREEYGIVFHRMVVVAVNLNGVTPNVLLVRVAFMVWQTETN